MNIKVFRIEWAASAMEMSVLAASNVANLIKVELVIYNVTYLVEFSFVKFQNDWIGTRENSLHEKEEL